MAAIDFVERLREVFGESSVRGLFPLRRLSDGRLEELAWHRKWVRSEGRFGLPLTWKGVTQAFSKANHAAEDFSHVTFIDCSFEWSDLRCASFANAILVNVQFEHCDLEQCDFAGAKLEDVAFENCFDLEKANFKEAIFLPSPEIALRSFDQAHEAG